MSKTIVVVAIFLVILGIYKITHMRWYGSGPNRISALGYQVEIHKVTTDDGYILELHRIPHPKKYEGGIMKRPVVLFVHGVYSTTDTFLLNGQENSLGFQAANEGFDVWLVNLRGNHYSSNHLNLSTLTMKYWDFSFHEMAVFDIPSTIDYILKKTGQKSLHYVGHSLGSLVFFVFLSEKPEYNIKLKTGHLLSAGINPEETRIGRVLGGRIGMFVMKLFDHGAIGVHFYLPPLNYSLWLICQTPLINNICLLALKLIGGPTTTINMVSLSSLGFHF
ncbi:LIPA.2 family protein [Megaselia abdita]